MTKTAAPRIAMVGRKKRGKNQIVEQNPRSTSIQRLFDARPEMNESSSSR
jgi:hypothetical protein